MPSYKKRGTDCTADMHEIPVKKASMNAPKLAAKESMQASLDITTSTTSTTLLQVCSTCEFITQAGCKT